MVLCVLGYDDESTPYLFKFKSDERVGGDFYYKVLRYTIFPKLKKHAQTSVICSRSMRLLTTQPKRYKTSVKNT